VALDTIFVEGIPVERTKNLSQFGVPYVNVIRILGVPPVYGFRIDPQRDLSHKTRNMNSSTRTLEVAIRCNNQGAHLLNAGNLLGAIHTFRQGMEILQSAPAIDDFADDKQRQEKDESILECHDCSDGQFFVYRQPLWLPKNLLAGARIHTETAGLVTAMVSTHLIFNLALSCHLLGHETGRCQPLDRALELYHIVLLSSGHPMLQSMGNGDGIISSALLQCLILNNLAHVHHEQCTYDDSEWCLASMETIVMQTGCLDDVERISLYLHEHEVEELKLNLVFSQSPVAAHAA
jgi:hypothetical protein